MYLAPMELIRKKIAGNKFTNLVPMIQEVEVVEVSGQTVELSLEPGPSKLMEVKSDIDHVTHLFQETQDPKEVVEVEEELPGNEFIGVQRMAVEV